MKYMQTGSFKSNPLMRVTISASLVFFIGFCITTFLMYFAKMGLTPASVVSYYRGSEAAFTMPRTYRSMLEVTHGHLPVMALVALLLSHLFIFTPFSAKIKYLSIFTFFGAALLGEASSWLVRFVHPAFAWLKIISFITLEVSMAFVIFALFGLLRAVPQNGKLSPSPKETIEVDP